MALETRPFPELSGQALIDFLEKVKNFKSKVTREEIIENLRWVRRETDRIRKEEEEYDIFMLKSDKNLPDRKEGSSSQDGEKNEVEKKPYHWEEWDDPREEEGEEGEEESKNLK
jgi:hypothetical protein